jgi:cytochrome P450
MLSHPFVSFRSSSVFLPFGIGGENQCPGKQFARNEMKLLFMFLILNLDFKLLNLTVIPSFETGKTGIGIYPPRDDVKVVISRKEV